MSLKMIKMFNKIAMRPVNNSENSFLAFLKL